MWGKSSDIALFFTQGVGGLIFGGFFDKNQGFGGTNNHAGGDVAVGTEIAANHDGTSVDDSLRQRIKRACHHTAPTADAIFNAVVHQARVGIFGDIAHNAGVNAFRVVAVSADELDLVSLEQVATYCDPRQSGIIDAKVRDGT